MTWIWSELLHQGLHHLCTFKRVLRIDRVALNWVNLYIIRLIFHFFCKDWQIGQPKWFWCREIHMFEACGLMGCLLWMGKRVYSFNCKEYIPCSRPEDFYYGTYRADKHGIVLLGALVLVLLYRWKHSDTWFLTGEKSSSALCMPESNGTQFLNFPHESLEMSSETNGTGGYRRNLLAQIPPVNRRPGPTRLLLTDICSLY